MKTSDVLTTGQIAVICRVAPRTVSKWIDRGALRGWKIPNSNDRRVQRSDLLSFMNENNIPVPPMLGARLVLLISESPASMAGVVDDLFSAGYEAVTVSNLFAAGMTFKAQSPFAIVVSLDMGLVAASQVAASVPVPVVLYGEHDKWTGPSAVRGASLIRAIQAADQPVIIPSPPRVAKKAQ